VADFPDFRPDYRIITAFSLAPLKYHQYQWHQIS
jgi:hypothetical protein